MSRCQRGPTRGLPLGPLLAAVSLPPDCNGPTLARRLTALGAAPIDESRAAVWVKRGEIGERTADGLFACHAIPHPYEVWPALWEGVA